MNKNDFRDIKDRALYWIIIAWEDEGPHGLPYTQQVVSSWLHNERSLREDAYAAVKSVVQYSMEKYKAEVGQERFRFVPHVFQHGVKGVEIKREHDLWCLYIDGNCVERIEDINAEIS